jgi:hypothetical protein
MERVIFDQLFEQSEQQQEESHILSIFIDHIEELTVTNC